MGPPQAEDALRECLAMGSGFRGPPFRRAFSGADTWATSTVLAAALRKLGPVDLVLAGRQATDGRHGPSGT
jgi:electron transfer flavoprotein beta subunit